MVKLECLRTPCCDLHCWATGLVLSPFSRPLPLLTHNDKAKARPGTSVPSLEPGRCAVLPELPAPSSVERLWEIGRRKRRLNSLRHCHLQSLWHSPATSQRYEGGSEKRCDRCEGKYAVQSLRLNNQTAERCAAGDGNLESGQHQRSGALRLIRSCLSDKALNTDRQSPESKTPKGDANCGNTWMGASE